MNIDLKGWGLEDSTPATSPTVLRTIDLGSLLFMEDVP